ncbi:Ferrochelatase [Pedobacter sp. Bi27]|uniref:ferrochelatase n=1 Tax=unclassified Pedobacter TaxID=2628915 RepID=UPI001DE29EC5|nr:MULTISPECIES: ferrochelatase [unclassified Pedobacter]CAH0175508.1 Ferrochelatase [Pedobacter sp. Bi27]CAH0297371.1 Ferrochelatase [Pedobacter sp. Bi36]CAH0307899.1 Ferrochelatase [Pedobacter sp. Bi126]
MSKKGILLVNLGTPDSPATADVKKYLDQFLMDERVIDIPKLNRTLLVKGIIVPFRSPKTAKLYKEIWNENGSPLLYYSRLQAEMLQERLGDDYHVELAMRYQSPSVASALANLKAGLVESIQVIPMFPQYASASTGSVMQLVMELVSKWPTVPPISFVNSFHDNELMIKVFAENAKKHHVESYDHVLFSFHGLPERQLLKCDHTGSYCLKSADCCQTLNDTNKFCYSAQGHDTARLIAKELNLSKDQYTVCFQSRLGKEPWVQPYTTDVLKKLAGEGKKRLLVFSPAFVADCLETLYEITVEYHEEFKALGGEHVQLVESLNDSPVFIEALAGMVK